MDNNETRIDKKKVIILPASLAILLIFATIWLFIDVGRIDISRLNLDISTLYSKVTGNSAEISALSSNLFYVQGLAENADMYAHFHGYSDARLKKNIKPIGDVMPFILQMEGVLFNWDKEKNKSKLAIFDDGTEIGLIAQDVELIFPELVHIDEDGYRHIDYARIAPILIEAIKEQQTQITSLEKKNSELEERIENLEHIIDNELSSRE